MRMRPVGVQGEHLCRALLDDARVEGFFALFALALLGIQSLLYSLHLLHSAADILEVICGGLEAPVDTPRQSRDMPMTRDLPAKIEVHLQRPADLLQSIPHPQPRGICRTALVAVQYAADCAAVVQYDFLGGIPLCRDRCRRIYSFFFSSEVSASRISRSIVRNPRTRLRNRTLAVLSASTTGLATSRMK